VVCVPIYAIITFITLIAPSAYNGLEIPIAIFEGYSFYCFFSLLVTNLGGPTEAVKALKNNDQPLQCACCCPSDKASFYNQTLWALFHFLFTRAIVVIVSVILEEFRVVFVILSLVAFVLLVYAVLSTVIFFENVYKHQINLMGVSKFIVIKSSVGLMVVQGLIIQILIATDNITLSDTSTYTGDERAIRIYCKLAVSYACLSLPSLCRFHRAL
jgi:hypothetical protein